MRERRSKFWTLPANTIDQTEPVLRPDQRVSLVLRLNVAILNALWHITTGEKLEYDDPKSMVIIKRINDLMTATPLGGLIFIIPWLKYIIPDLVTSLYTYTLYIFKILWLFAPTWRCTVQSYNINC